MWRRRRERSQVKLQATTNSGLQWLLRKAQLDLRRIRDAKIASIPVVIDEMLDPRALLGLCALDRG
jgi:hypothetical protein